jgi:hypothetical protein
LTDGVTAGRNEPLYPAMTWSETLGNMTWLEKWFQAARASLSK